MIGSLDLLFGLHSYINIWGRSSLEKRLVYCQILVQSSFHWKIFKMCSTSSFGMKIGGDMHIKFRLWIFFNSNFIVQKCFSNGSQSQLKLNGNVQINFNQTLNVDIFQYVRSNFMKFLSHDLGQINYKILWYIKF